MTGRVAIVCCAHHKPWLVMSTLITAVAQDHQDVDFHFIYNTGGGDRLYPDATALNSQLSPFDERVRAACALNRARVYEVEYQNDEALDSGAWYKFIRDRRWEPYDWVLLVGEGTLFARPTTLSAMLSLGTSNPDVHLIASGHEKRRLPKSVVWNYRTNAAVPTAADDIHDDGLRSAFEMFCRDVSFRALIDAWGDSFPVETQNHVPDAGPPSDLVRRLRSGWARRFGPPSEGGWVREWPWSIEYLSARARMLWPAPNESVHATEVHVNGIRRPVKDVAEVTHIRGTGFHRVDGPEWFGCATNHLMSRAFLERFTAKLDEFQIWDVLNLRFVGTPLEIIWGFVPAWLGYQKWFTDGFHRIRKDFATYRREDYPLEMATYINRYYRGLLAVRPDGDYLKIRAHRKELARLRDVLPAVYF